MFFVAQLKLASSSNNLFQRSISSYSNFMFIQDDTKKVKFYEIDKLVDKRNSRKRDIKYLVR